jgi:uncharacterized protein YjiS (DUF1127 family)
VNGGGYRRRVLQRGGDSQPQHKELSAMPSTRHLHRALARIPRPARTRRSRAPLSWPHYLFDRLAQWQERSRQRDHLQRLDDRLLKDIAVTRADIERETRKRFWRS